MHVCTYDLLGTVTGDALVDKDRQRKRQAGDLPAKVVDDELVLSWAEVVARGQVQHEPCPVAR